MTDATLAPRGHVLVVDDEADVRWVLGSLFEGDGMQVTLADGAEAALRRVDEHGVGAIDVVLSDVRMPGEGQGGLDLLRRLREVDEDLPVILLSAIEEVDTAVAAMKRGAYDYMTKPFDRARLLHAVHRAAERRRLRREVSTLRSRLGEDAVEFGTSAAGTELARRIDVLAAHRELSMLLVGESGTGKEVVARELHRRSPVADGPFVAVDCGALPESLVEGLLFGHVRGAFTGAERARRGLFLEADGGTLFLDEIGNLPVAMQPRLLRALQERSVVPVGGDGRQPLPFHARLVCATNADLRQAVQAGKFRLDLYHRIAEVQIELPPLRSRPQDVLHFARRFLREAAQEFGRRGSDLTDAAERRLVAHTWPGNLRELRNVVRRAVLLTSDEVLDAQDLALERAVAPAVHDPGDGDGPLAERLRSAQEELERRILHDTLATTGGNKAEAARLLHIDYTTLHRKLKRYRLAP